MYAKHLVTKILLLLYFLDIILIFLRGSEALSSQICLLSLNGKWKDESLSISYLDVCVSFRVLKALITVLIMYEDLERNMLCSIYLKSF